MKSSWGRPLVAVDLAWTRFETWLAVVAIALEVSSMTLWVLLKGLSTPAESESHGGVVFRALLGALVLGNVVHFALRRAREPVRRGMTLGGVAVGLIVARSWATVGVDYTSNLLNWYQQACSLTLFGGLRGVGTRLTLLLALLGGSLATARGKHVVLDIAARFVGPRYRPGLVVAGWLIAAVVSAAAAWGFLDHIAIENFGARADAGMGHKVSRIASQLGEDAFVATRQIELDFRSAPHVLRGENYADWLTGTKWNRFVATSGFTERFGADATRGIRIPDGERHAPLVIVPGRGEPRGELVRAANLIFPFGLLVIALRFVLRSALVASGFASAEPDPDDAVEPDAAAMGGQ